MILRPWLVWQGLISENNNSIFSSDSFSYEAAKKVLVNNPLSVLQKDGIVFYDEKKATVWILSKHIPPDEEVDKIRKMIEQKLTRYYSNLHSKSQTQFSETIQKAIQNLEKAISASDDFDKQNRSWEAIKELNSIWNFANSDDCYLKIQETKRPNRKIDMDDPRSIGELVREQMMLLSSSGYEFSDELFNQLCTIERSKKTFKLYYPFFKRIDPLKDINEQKRDHLGNNRYWKQVFSFKNGDVLITSEWYKYSKSSFINWYNSLVR